VILPPVSASVDRAAGWSWRLLVCAAAALAVLTVLWYLRDIVLPVMVALTIAPALAPLAGRLRRARLERPAAALAVLVFLGGFVPFVGAFVSGLVAVLVAFADEGWKIGLAALAIVVAVQFIEGNFLQPIIQSRTVDLHPAVILLAVAAGASLFGIASAYLAVPVTAVVFAVVASLRSDSLPEAAP
jgi:predicted PurR-regulated permease PerM